MSSRHHSFYVIAALGLFFPLLGCTNMHKSYGTPLPEYTEILHEGGLAAVAESLASCCTNLGVTMHLGVAPARIQTSDAATPTVTGVELENGEIIEAAIVLSTLDPQSGRTWIRTTDLSFIRAAL